jgi:hypothetical protein
MTAIHCPFCKVQLSSKDLTEGWCDACGKKLPSSVAQSPSRPPTPFYVTKPRSTLANVASWMRKISLAGMLFIMASCIGIPLWAEVISSGANNEGDTGNLTRPIIIAIQCALFFTLIATWLVSKGLAILAERGDH